MSRARRLGVLAASILAFVLAGYLLVKTFGVLFAVLYMVVFLVGVSLLPGIVALIGPAASMPTVGKLYFIFGQLAYGIGLLVQSASGYRMHPGRKTSEGLEMYTGSEWVPVENMGELTVVGFREFGMVLEKDEAAMADHRVQQGELASDGGGNTVVRAGYSEVPPHQSWKPNDGGEWWQIDLKRVFSKGVRKFGDIDVLEKAEEVAMRKEAAGSRFGGWQGTIEVAAGLLFGVVMAAMAMGGF